MAWLGGGGGGGGMQHRMVKNDISMPPIYGEHRFKSSCIFH